MHCVCVKGKVTSASGYFFNTAFLFLFTLFISLFLSSLTFIPYIAVPKAADFLIA